MTGRRREMAGGRFRTPLLNWLAELPPDGWEGTSHEPGDAMAACADRHRLVAFVPLCPGHKVADLTGFLSENGFTLTHRRTKHARTLRFGRVPSARRHS